MKNTAAIGNNSSRARCGRPPESEFIRLEIEPNNSSTLLWKNPGTALNLLTPKANKKKTMVMNHKKTVVLVIGSGPICPTTSAAIPACADAGKK
jgi:hypothetical protein